MIRIIQLNKHLDFPLTSKINEDVARYCINALDNEIMYTDKVGLEEMNEYHIAEFELIDGYYYGQGGNNTVNHVIEDLYNLRMKLKQYKHPAQMVIKLLMNPMYGNTIIKPVETDTIVKYCKDDFGKYASNNYNYID